MALLNIQEEIKKHSLESHQILFGENGVELPDRVKLAEHVFTEKAQERNKFEDMNLLLKFKTKEGKVFNVCIWELFCSSNTDFQFYGYCDVAYYGSGLFTNKEGFGFRLITGSIIFQKSGVPEAAYLQVMKENTFHR